VVITRGSVHWVDLGEPRGSEPAKRQPVVVVQSDALNLSRLATVVVAVLTSNTALAAVPGNVFVPAELSGLSKDSVVNVSALATVDKKALTKQAGLVPGHLLDQVDQGLRLTLGV